MDIATDLLVKTTLHTPLICCAGILEAERHCDITKVAIRRGERCLDFINDLIDVRTDL